MTQQGFYFDNARCTGCRTCEMACKDYKDLETAISFRHVYDYEGGEWVQEADSGYRQDSFVYHVSISCQHCDHPACVGVCPTHAMHKDGETGLVSVDASRCVGCGYCVMACPYDAPTVDREKGHSVKCDGCADRVAEGLQPICVQACPLRALDFGDIAALRSDHEGVDAIAPMPQGSYTSPNIVIKTSPDAREADDASGFIANALEVF